MPYARVVLNLPVDRPFDYEIPAEFAGRVQVGSRLLVPFGNRDKEAYCVELVETPDIPFVRAIRKVIDEAPTADPEILALTRWMADAYISSWGEALFAAIPSGAPKKPRGRRKPDLLGDIIFEAPKEITMMPEQEAALKSILSGPGTVLLYGATASGKTEVYLQAIEQRVREGFQSIVLVPEIALTPQTISRFKAKFPRTAVLHSMLTEAERGEQWRSARRGEVDVIVGVRSAVFAPVRKLGLIILDEEHETAYKQDRAPRYHAREVAIRRAAMAGATVILGSATPSLESFYKARTGEYRLAPLPHRVSDLKFPPIEIIDMEAEVKSQKRLVLISRRLRMAVTEAGARKEQSLLFLNRRGYTTYTSCARCGWVLRCGRCDVTLTFHKTTSAAVCHHCGRPVPLPETCPECKVGKLRHQGSGTERVEEEIRAILPELKVSRMDSDAMKTRGDYGHAIGDLWSGETDLLVGTQMIAKGFDVPNVTVVGVVSGDQAFHVPDFRAAERTFQLITQVAGRAGRGPAGGRVLVQTWNPRHPSITCAAAYDFETFAAHELELRKELGYPPFIRLVRVLFIGGRLDALEKAAGRFIEKFRAATDPLFVQILGPSPAPLPRIRNRFRIHCLIKAADLDPVLPTLRTLTEPLLRRGGVMVNVDVDPVSML